MPPTHSYHHGDLRQAVLTAAVAVLDESGPTQLSLRAVSYTHLTLPTTPYV